MLISSSQLIIYFFGSIITTMLFPSNAGALVGSPNSFTI